MAVDRPQPALRAREKRERRHAHQRKAEVKTGQPRADETHVVIQRQPAHEHVAGIGARHMAHGADVREQIGVRQHHALRVAGAARGVLQERDVIRENLGQCRARARVRQLAGGEHALQRIELRAQQQRHGFRFRHRDHETRAGIGEYRGVPAHVVFDLRQAHRRVDRHRHSAGEQNAEEAEEIITPGRQHDRHRAGGLEAALDQSCRDRARAVSQLRVADSLFPLVVAIEVYLQSGGMLCDVPVEHRGQRQRRFRNAVRAARGKGHDGLVGERVAPRVRRQHAADQIARRLDGVQRLVRQTHPEHAFSALHELDASQAVESQVPLQRTIERDRDSPLRMRFGDQLLDQPKQACRGFVGGRLAREIRIRHFNGLPVTFLQKRAPCQDNARNR